MKTPNPFGDKLWIFPNYYLPLPTGEPEYQYQLVSRLRKGRYAIEAQAQLPSFTRKQPNSLT